MKISDWLDEQEARNVDVSHIELPEDMSYDQIPDETIFFNEINRCGVLCSKDHPFSTVERFGHWYCARGRDRDADGIHSSKKEWRLFTKDRELALGVAKERLR